MKRLATWLGALAAIGILLSGVAWILTLSWKEGHQVPEGSSLGSEASGTRALFLLLEESGFNPRRLTAPAPKTKGILLTVEPQSGDESADRHLLDWVQEGGTLVLAGLPPPPKEEDGIPTKTLGDILGLARVQASVPADPCDLETSSWTGFRGARAEQHWRRLPRGGKALLGTPQAPVLLSFPLGQGKILALAEPSWLENGHLQEADRLRMALHLLVSPGLPVWFDEHRHGMKEERGLAWILERYGLLPAAVSIVLFLGLLVWRTSAPERTRPLDEAVRPPVRDALVETRASLYARSLSSKELLDLLEKNGRASLAEALGDHDCPPWPELVRRMGVRKPNLLRRLEEAVGQADWFRMRPPKDPEALVPLAQRLSSLEKETR